MNKLTMPTLLVVGSEDRGTPPEDQKLLYNKLPGDNELHIIEGSTHVFRESNHLKNY